MRWRGCLAERNFRLFFIAYATSIGGSAMVPVALTFAVLDEGRGVANVSYVLAADTVPLAVLLLFGGVIADRIPRALAMIGADAVRAVSEAVLAALLITGTPPLWTLLLLAGVLGAGQAFFNPAMTGLMPEIVAGDHLQQANSLRSLATSTGQIIGPAAAGVLVALGGAGWAIAVDAATYVVSTVCLTRMSIPARPRGLGSSMWAELAEGWQAVRSRSWLWAIVAQFSIFNALAYAPFMVLGAVVAREHLGGAAAWGTILALFAVGAIAGALASTRLRPRHPLVLATCGVALFTLPISLIAVPAPTAVIAAGAAVAGFGLATFDTLWETSLQQHVPGHLLSRVSAYDWFGSVTFVPVGFVLVAPLNALMGTRGVLILAAAVALASCVGALLVPGVRSLTRPVVIDGDR